MKDGRLNLRVRADLAEKIKEYAQRNNTTISAIVECYFLHILAVDEVNSVEAVEPAEQI